jgi:mannosyl-oligosaccharide alpha-1,2-mannosidase
MYIESTDSIQQKMLTRVPDHAPRLPEHQGRQWLFTNELNEDGHPSLQQDHLCCFAGGLFTLGALEVQRAERENAVLPSMYELSTRADKHRQIGKELTETCVELYEEQPTGLGPEIVSYGNVKPVGHERWKAHSSKYILRPETLEAIFYQYRATGDPIWRERGWRIFLNLVRHCRTPIAYSGVLDVRQNPAKQNDSQQSFLFAETFKYLWLLFADPNVLSLDQYVFSTEAHPFRRAH